MKIFAKVLFQICAPKTITMLPSHNSKRIAAPFVVCTQYYSKVWDKGSCLPESNYGNEELFNRQPL